MLATSPEQQRIIVERVRNRKIWPSVMTAEEYAAHVRRGGTDAHPTTNDQPVSFRRNLKIWEKEDGQIFTLGSYPVRYPYAERLDGSKGGIPRASFFCCLTIPPNYPLQRCFLATKKQGIDIPK